MTLYMMSKVVRNFEWLYNPETPDQVEIHRQWKVQYSALFNEEAWLLPYISGSLEQHENKVLNLFSYGIRPLDFIEGHLYLVVGVL